MRTEQNMTPSFIASGRAIVGRKGAYFWAEFGGRFLNWDRKFESTPLSQRVIAANELPASRTNRASLAQVALFL
jgi:hypothetical protein